MNIILVTGGAGFVGTNLIRFLLNKRNDYIISLDNYYSGSKKNHISSKKIKYLKGSTLNINSNKILSKANINIVYHFAEFSRIYPSFKYVDDCYKTNIIGTFEVLQFCLKKKAKLVYSASSSTIGKNKNLSPYSYTKYHNENLIKNYSKWFNLSYTIVYFYNVYGPNQIKSGKMQAVIGIFENQFLLKKPLSVVKPGTQKRDFTHVEDIVRGTYMASTKTKNKSYHIGSGKNYSLIDVAKMFKTKITYIDERPGERFGSLSNSQKAKRDFGYIPKKSLESYIKDFISKNK